METIYVVECVSEGSFKAFRKIEDARQYAMDYFLRNVKSWYTNETGWDVDECIEHILDDLDGIFNSSCCHTIEDALYTYRIELN